MSELDEDSRPNFTEYIAHQNLRAARLGSYLAGFLLPAGALLDLSSSAENFRSFLLARVVGGALCLGSAWLTCRNGAANYVRWLMLLPILITAGAFEAMIITVGEYSFPLFAAFTQLVLAVGVLYYWPFKTSALVLGMVLTIWLVPALSLPGLNDPKPLIDNFFAIFICALIAAASAAGRFALAKREFDAREKVLETSEQLTQTLSQIRELSQFKDQFFANISHELRTPLTLILGPAESLLAGDASDQGGKLRAIRRNAQRLLKLIDELLDLSKLDAGGLRLNIAEMDLGAIAKSVYDTAKPAAETKGLTFTVTGDAATKDIFGDAHRVEIILTNLVGNAFKYTEPGGAIELVVRSDENGGSISVRDTGPGIAEDDLPHVFDRFYQIGTGERRRKAGGVGIGLALAKELTELHGGDLTVTSKLGEGTTFTLTLQRGQTHFRPDAIERRKHLSHDEATRKRRKDDAAFASEPPFVARSQPVPAAALHSSAPVAKGQTIVVADDHEELRSYVANILQEDYVVLQAENGREALELVKAHKPDLVVSDVMMPEMTGTELCKRIKTAPELQQIPVILLTAKSGSEATLEAYSQGADDFVAKPFHPGVLMARVKAQLSIRQLGRKLVLQEKLYTVGSLAAGIAHEVRNPINAVVNAAKTLEDVPDLPAETRSKLLKVVLDGSERITGIISALDSHARPSEQNNPVGFSDPKEGLDATVRLLAHKMKGVEVEREYETNKLVEIPAGPINQVYLNIIDNAVRCGATKLWLSVKEHNGHVEVCIGDNGPGVPKDIQNRVFDPFFSTRAPGEGTGLGLHLSKSLVTQHGGDLTLHNRDPKGAEFRVSLPPHAGQ